jgi:hypothetical protein
MNDSNGKGSQLEPAGVSVYAEPELGFPIATGPLQVVADIPGEWGALHVTADDGSHWTLLSDDVELHRSLRATAVTATELSDALADAMTKHQYEWQLVGWPEEWPTMWPLFLDRNMPIAVRLVDDEE